MELVLNLPLSLYPTINMSILSYFGNKKEIPLLFFKEQKIEKIEREFFKKP